jgi:general secretion pathway protein A
MAAEDTPFSVSPNPNCLFVTPLIRSALAKTRYTVDKRQGLACVLGDNGLGKSSFLRFLYAEYGAKEDIETTLVPTPKFNSEFAMLKSICMDFGVEPKRSLTAQQEALQNFLMEKYKEEGKNVVLFIDEAQLLTNKMLEIVRTMLNYETHRHKLIQVVLAGQLELRDRLMSDANKAVKSRIVGSSLLAALSPDELDGMIEHRCHFEGVANPFTPEALERLYELTLGVPREALKTAGLAYEMMKSYQETEINVEMLDAVHSEAVFA